MDKLNNAACLNQPLILDATVTTVEGLSLRKESLPLRMDSLGPETLSFSTEKVFTIGQHLVLDICLSCLSSSSHNQIFGEVIWSQETTESNTYGLKIVSADNNYFQITGTPVERFHTKELVGGRH
ncbi:hypothetical protein [Aquibacillus salsiterrae]|uniref:PilZ domain-containing protein n=1 Tax=Aquibacillus salsiterrae TaxID=2950439 RepID=A0A9X4ADW9_9BACI|nr:hypothetical protein [Aquibacillus salsiterrae]MDC3415976.1 hypothetical protein [Aquibacillus salsiterrae]